MFKIVFALLALAIATQAHLIVHKSVLSENVIWTAGARPNALIEDLGLPLAGRNGVKVDEYLRVDGHDDVWCIGDCASIPDIRPKDQGGSDRPIPPNAQAAIQEGYVAANNILAAIDGDESRMQKFEYKPLGQLVELGSDFAVNEVMGVRFTGLLAALFWRMAYLVRLNSPQSRARIAADWVLGAVLKPAVTQTRGTSKE